MTTWRYTDADNRVVSRTLENGGMASCLVIAQEVQDWIAAGNKPIPYDPPKTDRRAEILGQLAAIDAKSIRPMRDGDTEYINKLGEQAKALREELAKI